jgi:hypothetical protein
VFSVAIGQQVKVAGWASRTRASMLVSNVLLPSGAEALFYPQSQLRWSDRQAGGEWARESVGNEERDLYPSGASPISALISQWLEVLPSS